MLDGGVRSGALRVTWGRGADGCATMFWMDGVRVDAGSGLLVSSLTLPLTLLPCRGLIYQISLVWTLGYGDVWPNLVSIPSKTLTRIERGKS